MNRLRLTRDLFTPNGQLIGNDGEVLSEETLLEHFHPSLLACTALFKPVPVLGGPLAQTLVVLFAHKLILHLEHHDMFLGSLDHVDQIDLVANHLNQFINEGKLKKLA